MNRFSFILLFVLAACADPQSSLPVYHKPVIDLANADYGEYPKSYKLNIEAFYQAALKDPDSAKISIINKPHKDYAIYNGEPVYGYSVCVSINAKNSFGGYVGAHTDWFLFRNDAVARYMGPETQVLLDHPVNCESGD